MKGYAKGVNFKTSATPHFAEGGSVAKRPASDFTPGANREANVRDGWAPNLPKAAREEIEARFGKGPQFTKKEYLAKIAPVKKARGGGILGQVAAKLAPAAQKRALPRPASAAGARGVPSHSSKPMFGRSAIMQKAKGGVIECIPAKTRAVQLKSEAGEHIRDAKRLDPAMKKASGGAVCTPAKMKAVADAEISKHVSAPAPKGHKGLKA